MAEVFMENPPVLTGSAENQLRQLYGHLFKMSEQLNQALMNITIEQMAPAAQEAIRTGGEAAQQNQNERETLKSMIVKTAEVIRSEMTEIRTVLEGHYEAISEQFGTYKEDIQQELSATASGINQVYTLVETVQGTEEETASVLRKLNANIFSGILDPVTGEVGIAIGYNVTNNDGSLNQTNKMATFTADRLTFFLNNVAAAYFSNSIFHIADGEIMNSLKMGSYIWKTLSSGAMGLIKA